MVYCIRSCRTEYCEGTYMNIGRNIYELRKEKGLTQAQLAEKMGVTEQAVSKWENGASHT